MIEIQNVKLSKLAFLCLLTFMLVSLVSPKVWAQNLPTVNVAVEGKPLVMLVPPVIIEDRTMVAVRSVSEAVGGTVEWDPVKRQVTVTRFADSIILTVGQKEAVVNGQVMALPVAPQIVNDRTMVPLRFIAEALGGTVEWQEQTRTVNILRKPTAITAMTYTPGTGQSVVTLTLSEPLMSTKPTVTENTVALDLYPATIAIDPAERRVMDAMLQALALKTDGRMVRFEARLWHRPLYRYSVSENGLQITVEFDHTITGFQFRQDERIPTVSVQTTGKLEYTAFALDNPPRLVMDLPGVRRSLGTPETVVLNNPHVTQIRSAENQPGVTRVVLDMKTSVPPFEVVTSELGLQVRFVPRIQAVRTEKRQGMTRLTFAGSLPMDAVVTAPAGQRKLLIEVPQGVSGLKEHLIKVGDGTVDTITVAPGTKADSTLITVALPYYLGHTVVSKNGDSSIVVDLITSPVYGKRIWVDAGHGRIPGGNDDPGSIGRTYKTYEKAANLAIALELQRRLQEAGATVLMTRTGDEGIDFTKRPALVNAAKPPVDLFVSIHHNSAGNVTVRGIETYYWTTNPRSKSAAEKIHAALVKGLGFPDRRVRMESFVVIKDTRAPAVLLEMGYLSNAEEEKAIAEPGVAKKTYPGRAAEAIKNGLFDYFWQEIR